MALGDKADGQYAYADAGLLNNIALAHLRRWRVKQAPEEAQTALEWYKQALRLSRENRDIRTEVRALTGKAESHMALNQLELALKDIDQAIATAEKIRAEMASQEYRILSQPLMAYIYRIQVHALMWRHQLYPDAGYDILALRAVEQCRLRAMLELLSESRVDLSQGIGAEYLARLKELQLKLEAAEERRAQSLNHRQTEKLARIDKEIEELLREKDLLDEEIRDNHPQYAALKTPVPPRHTSWPFWPIRSSAPMMSAWNSAPERRSRRIIGWIRPGAREAPPRRRKSSLMSKGPQPIPAYSFSDDCFSAARKPKRSPDCCPPPSD